MILLNTLIGAFSFVLVLGILVFFHELGHYSIARLFNVRVDRFSIGFGKPLWKRKAKSGTEWVIASIPLGGYVKFFGDAGAASNPDSEKLKQIRTDIEKKHGKDAWKTCFHFKPLWQRALIVAAGPAANFILAIVFFASIALFFGTNSLSSKVLEVQPQSPAYMAGIKPGDKIISINGQRADEAHLVSQIVALRSGDDLDILIERDGKKITITARPKRVEGRDGVGGKMQMGRLGVQLGGDLTRKQYNLPQSIAYGGKTFANVLSGTTQYIARIFKGKEDGKALGGIVKIAAVTGKVGAQAANIDGGVTHKLKSYIAQILWLSAVLSVGLGFANLMPIPVLDGGHLLYYLYEAVMRKPLSERAQEIGFRFGMALLLALFLVLTINDIRYLPGLFEKTG